MLGICAAVVLAFTVLMALLAPVIAPGGVGDTDLSSAYSGPSADHPLGADALGRDLLARLVWGARTALLGPLVVIVLAGTIGTAVGIVAAWRGGTLDLVAARGLDVLFAIPGILLALLAVAMFGTGLVPAAIGLSIGYLPYVARITRASALRERSMPYISASIVQGQASWVICLRHLLPNVAPVVLAQVTILFGYAMVDLSAIAFLGLGVQPPTADWGLMVQEGQAGVLAGHPQQALYAGGAIVLIVVAVNVLGDRLLDVAEGRRR